MAQSNAICLAEVGIGALRLGVPVESVLEAIPLPAAPGQLPRRRGALLGVVEHGGRLVPVVDLARWVEVGAAERSDDAGVGAGARVLVLHEGGRTVGLKVDAVGGLVEVQAADVMRLHHDDDPEEVFHSAARAPGGRQVLSLLDCDRLARLAAVWSEDAAPADARNGTHEAVPDADAAARAYALLQVGAQQLAVPAEALAEVIPMPRLERFGGGIDSTWCRWRGRHLPVLPPGTLPAQAGDVDDADDAGSSAPLLAVIERAGLALGLPVRAVLRLDSFGAGLSTPGGLVATAYDNDGRPVQLLDDDALFARFPEAALSRDGILADAGTAAAVQHEHEAGNAVAYIVYEADGLAAIAIDAVERIVGPNEAAALSQDADGAGCMHWDGRAIPVRDLRAPAHAHAHAAPHLLLVRGPAGLRACAVARVHLLIPPGGGRVYRMGRSIEFITAGEGAAQASYRIVDLKAG